ncbi:MAG: hypothetical protein U0165_04865 [Polyangiaceae bacterium]
MRFPIKISDNFLVEPLLDTFGVNTETSFVELVEGALHLKMGGWFDETIPLSNIAAIAPSDWPWWGGLGVKLGHHGVGLVGAQEGIVNLKLKEPAKVRVLVSAQVEQVWLSLKDPLAFLSAVSDATKLPVGPHTPF